MASSAREGAPYGAPWDTMDQSGQNPLSRQRRMSIPAELTLFRHQKGHFLVPFWILWRKQIAFGQKVAERSSQDDRNQSLPGQLQQN